MLDTRLPGRAEGSLRALFAVLLDHLEFLQEQGRGQEPARAPVAAVVDREAGGRQRRLRPAGLREADDAEDLGGRGAAEGHALSLPKPLSPSEAVDCGLAGAAKDCAADLRRGHADENVPALRSRRTDGKDARLGGRRVRRLHADLKQWIQAAATQLTRGRRAVFTGRRAEVR